ncbi:OmpA family protein [Marinilabiliaceae bacterium ANBcel2]|nr:OmpA family protein [Marinilabiliaceae bacterium ANBcel2]
MEKYFKSCIVIFILLLFVTEVAGQGAMLRRADSFYERGEFYEALQLYNQVEESGYELEIDEQIRVAVCYYELNNIQEAFSLFLELEDYLGGYELFIYASTTHRFGYYEGAIDLYEKARAQNPDLRDQIDELINSCEWALENDYFVPGVRVNPSTIMTFGQSFGIQYYHDGVVYSSASEDDETGRDRTGRSILNLYYSDLDDEEGVHSRRLFSENLVFPEHVGAISFTSDYTTMYYTRSVRVRGGESRIKIFSVIYDGNDWNEELELEINSDDHDNAHPAVSPCDNYLYFVSNRSGGYGGTDIWVVERLGDRRYGSPSNLGPRVNTFGDERYPFISQDNTLYFASDGHYGFGGLDIFRASYDNGIWGDVENMMKPFNSEKDDFGYVINPNDPNEGFLSTNRYGDGSEDAIFYVEILDEEEEEEEETRSRAPIVGLIVDEDPEPDPEPIVEEEPETVVEEPKVDPGIFPDKFSSVVVSTLNNDPVNDGRVVFTDAFTGSEISVVYTNRDGSFEIDIPDRYRQENQEFEILVTKDDFNSNEVVADILELNELGRAGISLTPVFDEVDLDAISGLIIPYRDDEITSDGYDKLDQVASYLASNPSVVIRLNGHTEARGNRLNNLNLSQRIADVAKNYLMNNGVNSENVIARGYGDRYVVNHCKRGQVCSEAEHLENRRIEVVIWNLNQ